MIATVGIVTQDRLPSLVACLQRYLGNCQRHARSPEFLIADDTLSPDAVEQTKAAIRTLADHFHARVRYLGRQEKTQFSAALALQSGVSDEIVRFALFGDERCSFSVGANRNCLLLDSAGTLVLAVDDDTLCRIAEAPGIEAETTFFPGYDPTEFWFFPDRDSAIHAVSQVDVDVLHCLEELLGRPLAGFAGFGRRKAAWP